MKRIGLVGAEEVVERHDPVRQIAAEAADIADREDVGGDVHRQLAQIDVADASAGDQRLGADQRQRGDGVGRAPQERERRGDQPGAQDRRAA